ncbi:MAG: HAD family hydrolase [Alphaproteobacteria bacterium]|nr:HAD family hydrolase [Alphaproteobacteria bacterium]
MKVVKPTIVLFDMDGTTVRHVNPSFLSILEFLDDIIYRGSRFFSRNNEIVDLSGDPAAPRGLLVHRALHKIRRKPVDQIVQPCPGILPLLNLFKRQNIPMGIVSNGLGKGYGHDILEKFKLEPYFQAQIFREDIHKSKPHPDPILRALRAIKAEPDADDIIWYIGDRHKDIEAAIAANKLLEAKVVPFSYGLNAAVAVLKHNIGTDHIIMNYPDFFTRIKKIILAKENVIAVNIPDQNDTPNFQKSPLEKNAHVQTKE